ncbi:MAG: histidine triad nucleotide-binding protein [Clostridia bacterium]|nr:histidine triad nucleotide-binding protein [Clostridia bacterium]MDD4375506.1 histidine triad nucleotide-binding protein [Clostridia bacterium]
MEENNCLFCKIIANEIPSKKVYEDENVYAFHDISPVTPIHIIVIPKVHIESVNFVNIDNSKYLSRIFEVIPVIAEIMKIKERGYRVITNVGEEGGQTIKHLHFHIIGGKKLDTKIIND